MSSNSHRKINDSFLEENKYIFKKYKPIKLIDKGNCGKIYSVINIQDLNPFAMKTEEKNVKHKVLESEAYFLFILQGFGIPKLITYGHTKNYNILIETLLDKSLYSIFIKNKKKCNIIDLCLIAIQLLDRLEWIHSKDIIYRDVKPQNFLIGIDDPNVIYIVDFGVCKKYRSSKTGKHILPKITKKFTGTLSYASSNVIIGKESSRRDDLISLGYVLIKLFKGYLPWSSNFGEINKSLFEQLFYLKITNGYGKLFEGLTEELVDYVKYCKKLKFEEDPNYSYLSSLFIKIITKSSLKYKNISFSWINNRNSNKKLLGLPNNNSSRKSNSRCRLLKNLKEQRKKRVISNSLAMSNTDTNPHDFSIFNNKKNLTAEPSDNYREIALINNKKENNYIKINNLKSKISLTTKDNNNSDRKKICKNKINNLINKNKFVEKIEIKKNCFLNNNNENKINNICKNNENKTKNIYKENRINKIDNPIFKSNIIINTFNLDNNIFDTPKNINIREIHSKNNFLCPSLINLKKTKILSNLHKNIEYKSPISKINYKIIRNEKQKKFSIRNLPKKFDILNSKMANSNKFINGMIINRKNKINNNNNNKTEFNLYKNLYKYNNNLNINNYFKLFKSNNATPQKNNHKINPKLNNHLKNNSINKKIFS